MILPTGTIQNVMPWGATVNLVPVFYFDNVNTTKFCSKGSRIRVTSRFAGNSVVYYMMGAESL